MQSTQAKFFNKHLPEISVVVLALAMGILMSINLYKQNFTLSLTDEYAHLNFSRMLFQSMTPGISQIGFWPPLLHLLMAPFTLIKPLYSSGLAGAFVLVPFLALGAFFLYKLCFLFTQNKWLSFLGSVMFVINPYVLYYSAVPMMEILFLANLFGTAYFTALWLKHDNFKYLFGMALFVTLTTLSRFEGLILLPLLLIIIVINLVRRGKTFAQGQSLVILFSFVAVLGAATVFLYSWIFGGSPMAFTGTTWIAQPAFSFPTGHSIFNSAYYLLYASYYMISQPLIIFSVLMLFVLLLLANRKFELFSTLAVLISPVAFIVLALYTGSFQLAVPDLPPNNIFLNERYGLTWIGFVIVASVVALGYVLLRTEGRKFLRYAAVGTCVIAAGTLGYLSVDNFYNVAVSQNYFVIRDNINSPRAQQDQVADYLAHNYDFGKILITRNDNDPVLAQAGLSLSDYIYEGNYLYFNQSLQEPWMFARYVVMHNPTDPHPKSIETSDKITAAWVNDKQFNYYYELVVQNPKRLVYKIRADRVRDMAINNKLDVAAIPSINPDLTWWDPSNIYAKIQSGSTVGIKN